jgi:hypothetical protein
LSSGREHRTGYFLDATQGYGGIRGNYTVAFSDDRRGEGVEWFTLAPGREAARELVGATFEIAVDTEPGLIIEYRASDGNDNTVVMRVISLDLDCPVGEALQIPSAVQNSKIIDATTGLPIKD